MRLIDADAAIKDYDVHLMKYFLEKQPTVFARWENSKGCEACNNKYCMTCTYQLVDEGSEPCFSCSSEHRNYKPTNYCPECGKRLVE